MAKFNLMEDKLKVQQTIMVDISQVGKFYLMERIRRLLDITQDGSGKVIQYVYELVSLDGLVFKHYQLLLCFLSSSHLTKKGMIVIS